MTAAQRSKAVKRRKEIWEALHPVMKIAVGQVVPPQSQSPMARPQEKAFAAETAALTGEDKRTINRHIARVIEFARDWSERQNNAPSIVKSGLHFTLSGNAPGFTSLSRSASLRIQRPALCWVFFCQCMSK